jgi:hypothetical protein
MIDHDFLDQQVRDDEMRKQDALNSWRRDTPGSRKQSTFSIIFETAAIGAVAFGFLGVLGGLGLAAQQSLTAQQPGGGWLIILGPLYMVTAGGIGAIVGAVAFPIFRGIFGLFPSGD